MKKKMCIFTVTTFILGLAFAGSPQTTTKETEKPTVTKEAPTAPVTAAPTGKSAGNEKATMHPTTYKSHTKAKKAEPATPGQHHPQPKPPEHSPQETPD